MSPRPILRRTPARLRSRWALLAAALPLTALAADPLPMLSGSLEQGFTVKTQILVLMTLLGLLPTLVMSMTSFLRYVIVLSLLKQALGLQQGLPQRVVTGVALVLTLLVMRPVGQQVWDNALQPWDQDKITAQEALRRGDEPISRFMLAQTDKATLANIARISGSSPSLPPMQQPFVVKLASYVLSELKTSFQIGCMLFIPFLVIDIIVASVLMSMGMMMLSPLVISLPLKLLLFVLVDGWSLTVNTLITSVQGY
jgi:flagellar biosynthesis protein FliP